MNEVSYGDISHITLLADEDCDATVERAFEVIVNNGITLLEEAFSDIYRDEEDRQEEFDFLVFGIDD